MNTDLQTLSKEIDDLRNENINLHNELVKQNKILFEQVISIGKELANQQKNLLGAISFFNGQNLQNYLVRLAGIQTADFIAKDMNTIKAFKNRTEYLRYVINQCNVSGGGGI